ncbi:hypothetical protein [Streptomyces sp. NPDC008125]|uniref:hypothetical protein n=1 Tax=Streptomyces sp. NPDC008125 TaxID=3364811 RepID=UPI0036EC9A16
MDKAVDYAVFALGCLLVVTGAVSTALGWAPSWLRHIDRPRLFGAWALLLGAFCVTQLPALRDGLTRIGSAAADARGLLLLASAAALLLGLRRASGR